MEYIEISAKTVDDALTEACLKLSTTSDKLEYEVLEEGSSGFLGFNAKPAIINARVKEEEAKPNDQLPPTAIQTLDSMIINNETSTTKESNIIDELSTLLISKFTPLLDSYKKEFQSLDRDIFEFVSILSFVDVNVSITSP